jgi:hypothetical protein
MIWWFLILALSVGAIAWAGISLYLRVQRHMRAPDGGSPAKEEVEIEG